VNGGVLGRFVLLLVKPTFAIQYQDTSRTSLRDSLAWSMVETLASSPKAAVAMVSSIAWLELLCVLAGLNDFTSTWVARVGASKCLSRLLWDTSSGATLGTKNALSFSLACDWID
jgi:hypothetical protein